MECVLLEEAWGYMKRVGVHAEDLHLIGHQGRRLERGEYDEQRRKTDDPLPGGEPDPEARAR